MSLTYQQKTGCGAALATAGALGIVLSQLLGWNDVPSPWDFVLGFVFGVMSGSGAALALFGLFERRASQ